MDLVKVTESLDAVDGLHGGVLMRKLVCSDRLLSNDIVNIVN